jgi:hypothetical protein
MKWCAVISTTDQLTAFLLLQWIDDKGHWTSVNVDLWMTVASLKVSIAKCRHAPALNMQLVVMKFAVGRSLLRRKVT